MTVVRSNGSTPQRAGAKMLVFPDGRTIGTIGGAVTRTTRSGKRARRWPRGRSASLHYELNDDFAQENGLGGEQMDVHIDPLEPTRASSSSARATWAGTWAGSRSTRDSVSIVVDDREKFANAERFPGAEAVDRGAHPRMAPSHRDPASAYVVVVTRGTRTISTRCDRSPPAT